MTVDKEVEYDVVYDYSELVFSIHVIPIGTKKFEEMKVQR